MRIEGSAVRMEGSTMRIEGVYLAGDLKHVEGNVTFWLCDNLLLMCECTCAEVTLLLEREGRRSWRGGIR